MNREKRQTPMPRRLPNSSHRLYMNCCACHRIHARATLSTQLSARYRSLALRIAQALTTAEGGRRRPRACPLTQAQQSQIVFGTGFVWDGHGSLSSRAGRPRDHFFSAATSDARHATTLPSMIYPSTTGNAPTHLHSLAST